MFKKEQRYSFKKGLPRHYFNTTYFSLRYQKSSDNRLHSAIVVGKKIDKRASVRNRLKRQFTHALKELLAEKDIQYELLFYLKQHIQELDFVNMKQHIETVLKKIHILES